MAKIKCAHNTQLFFSDTLYESTANVDSNGATISTTVWQKRQDTHQEMR